MFSELFPFAFRKHNFSSKQRPHRFPPGVYAAARFKMDHTSFNVNHKTSFNLYNHSSDTKLSKYVWSLKQSRRNYSIKWSILKRAAAYTPGGKRCGPCLEEKLCILKAKGNNSLNTRSEFYAKCCHKEKFSACKFKPVTR